MVSYKNMQRASVALNSFAVFTSIVAAILNIYAGNLFMAVAMVVLMLMNAYFAYTGYLRYLKELQYEEEMRLHMERSWSK